MRLFIAVEIENKEALDKIIRVKDAVLSCGNRKSLKPVKNENIHITLRFLGEISDESVPELIECIRRAEAVKKFTIGIKGVGAFPTASRPRVIWVGVSEGAEELRKLKEIMDPCLNHLAKPERNPYTPHITIARVKGRINSECFKGIIESFGNEFFGYSPIRSVKLKRSILRPEGPIYSDVYVAELEGELGSGGSKNP